MELVSVQLYPIDRELLRALMSRQALLMRQAGEAIRAGDPVSVGKDGKLYAARAPAPPKLVRGIKGVLGTVKDRS